MVSDTTQGVFDWLQVKERQHFNMKMSMIAIDDFLELHNIQVYDIADNSDEHIVKTGTQQKSFSNAMDAYKFALSCLPIVTL